MDVGDRNGRQHFLLPTSASNIDLINDWSPILCRALSGHHKFGFLQYFKLKFDFEQQVHCNQSLNSELSIPILGRICFRSENMTSRWIKSWFTNLADPLVWIILNDSFFKRIYFLEKLKVILRNVTYLMTLIYFSVAF